MNIFERESGLRLVVLAGGDSPEREISLRSGAAVAAALASANHQVTPIDPREFPLAEIDWANFDACFVALHGGAGEDGRVQEMLERIGIPYTGSGPDACRLAMNKSESKRRFEACGVPTPPFVLLEPELSEHEILKRTSVLDYPLVIKPNAQGSSLGLAIADSPAGVLKCAANALQYDGLAVAEPLISGREFTVALLDDRALPLVEIVSPERVFSFDAKYHSSLTEYVFGFELTSRKRAEILHGAVRAAQSLGTAGLARVDLMLGHDGRIWVLEVNTIPGMTPRSLAPQAALRAGLDLPALCDLMVRKCLSTVHAS